ncbi:MAG: hypothetical protein GY804_15515 [Alphaproteobacteria bacterium]|nr:hypothetical protein [Alphaproteobacteria bacterium]
MDLIIPPKLQKGDTVGIIAPSKAPYNNEFTKQKTQQGISFLKSFGLKVKFANHVYDNNYHNGATIQNRIQDIHDMFLDPEVKMVMTIVGGDFANLVIDKLDYDLIRNNPKIFCSMSDGTLLTNSIYLKADLQTYYGINLNDSIGCPNSAKIKANFYDTFFTNKDITITENKELIFTKWGTGDSTVGYNGWNVIKTGKREGILTGGYLKRLITTDYAGFNIDYNNRILFFETGDNLKDLAISITSMEQKGILKQLRGMIIGYCYNFENQQEVANLLEDLLKDYDFPVIQIGELGHDVENYSFPIGAKATIDTDSKQIIISK